LKIYKTSDLAVGNSTGATSGVTDLTADALTVAGGYHKDFMTNMDASYNPALKTWIIPEGYAEFKMQHVFVLGANALTRTGLSGQDSAKMFTKGLGSSGVMDPIDQRQTIGFKINSIGFGSTRPEAIVDYVCAPSLLNNASIYEAEQGVYISGDPAAPSTVATPTANPNGGAVASGAEVTLASGTSGASFFYTLDGSAPVTYNAARPNVPIYSATGEWYDGAAKPTITAATGLVLKFVAIKAGMIPSAIVSKTFTISG
jgi:hypothetical protein